MEQGAVRNVIVSFFVGFVAAQAVWWFAAGESFGASAGGGFNMRFALLDIVEVLVRNAGRLVSQRQLLHDVWGPDYETETEYLRVLMGRVRRKLEVDHSRPRHFRTEPGMGYRFEP